MREVLVLTEKAHTACFELKKRGLIKHMIDGDPQASLADAVRQLKALIVHSERDSRT